MTECEYKERLKTFESVIKPEPVCEVRVMEEGKAAIEKINRHLGLGLDEWDIDYYFNLFVRDMKRNPTNVECFDLGQSNSDIPGTGFSGPACIDGTTIPHTLMEIIKRPYNENRTYDCFQANSSAIRGYKIKTIIPENREAFSFDKELTPHTFTARPTTSRQALLLSPAQRQAQAEG